MRPSCEYLTKMIRWGRFCAPGLALHELNLPVFGKFGCSRWVFVMLCVASNSPLFGNGDVAVSLKHWSDRFLCRRSNPVCFGGFKYDFFEFGKSKLFIAHF